MVCAFQIQESTTIITGVSETVAHSRGCVLECAAAKAEVENTWDLTGDTSSGLYRCCEGDKCNTGSAAPLPSGGGGNSGADDVTATTSLLVTILLCATLWNAISNT